MKRYLENQNVYLLKAAEEAIHTINKIQPYGILLVLEEPDLKVLQVSNNITSILGVEPSDILERNLEDIIDPLVAKGIKTGLLEEDIDLITSSKIWFKKNNNYIFFDGIFHRNSQGLIILELEPNSSQKAIPFLHFYNVLKETKNDLAEADHSEGFYQKIVRQVRKVTGFDRVMVYKFDDDGHGSVIAEEKREDLESYLGLHYPESDIPKEARRLFCSKFIRCIPDTRIASVEIVPKINRVTKNIIDLSNSVLRSPSECHIEYLHNMGVGASLTISLIKEDKLWGLIACHHQQPKHVSYEQRKACEFLGKVTFTEILAREKAENYDYHMKIASIQSTLIDNMYQAENFIDALTQKQANILDLTNAQGAAIYFGGRWTKLGETPTTEELNFLVEWLKHNIEEEVFYTNCLAGIYPDAEKFKNVGSGLLAIPISQRNYLLWFRAEVIQHVSWGGDPNRPYDINQDKHGLRLTPRTSFELWKQTVESTSLPWQDIEVKAGLELCKAIINIVLKQNEKLVRLAATLERSNQKFAYINPHDLQVSLDRVGNYLQLLEMQCKNLPDEDLDEFSNHAVESINSVQTLIDQLSIYSKVNVQGGDFQEIEAETALEKALKNLHRRILKTEAIITHSNLPTIMADRRQLIQLFQNLISNAIKFRSEKHVKIHIHASRIKDEWLFGIRDNGIGIDPKFSDRIFEIFQCLHIRNEYPGTGIGLAICKKIVEYHRGRIWVESQLGEGATFYFTIPMERAEKP